MKAEKVRWRLLQAFTEGVTLNQDNYDEVEEEISELERLAEIGRATERMFEVFDKVECTVVTYPIGEPYENIVVIPKTEDLLEWAKGE